MGMNFLALHVAARIELGVDAPTCMPFFGDGTDLYHSSMRSNYDVVANV